MQRSVRQETSVNEKVSENTPPTPETTRRAVVLGAGGAGLVAVLTACAGYGEPNQAVAEDASAAEAETDIGTPASSGPADEADGGEGGGTGFAQTSEIPEGGGKVFKDQKIVVTQPAPGQFKGFSITCTHQGCDVDTVADGTINCPCHGSRFSIADGSVKGGPASRPLPEKPIKVDGTSIALA